MRPDLDEALVRDFPCLFRLRHELRDGPREPISFGFEIEDGWEPIVRRLAEKLEPIARETTLRAVQVKEKNGGLRFYVEHGALPEDVVGMVRAAVAEARDQSARTCELCGGDGVLRGTHHVQTLCAQCADLLADLDPEMPAPTDRRLERALVQPDLEIEDRYKPLLARRVSRESIALGRAYLIHARNGGVGVAVEDDGRLGYQLRREKWGDHYLFVEYDWAEGPPYGTAIPLKLIEAGPPTDEDALLGWLEKQTGEHRAEIDAAWEVILGFPPGRYSSWKDRK
jgi:hypothetical protein